MADTTTTLDPADQAKQEAFVRIFCIVLIALSAFTIFCMMVARLMAGTAPALQDDPILKADLMSRIAPVGQVRTTADADTDTSAEATVVAAQSGEEIVQGVCAGCHLSGVAGAPLLDDEAAWAERRPMGLDALTASVINGKGAMPARAGTDLSDDELRRAVAHMVGIESEDAAASNTETTATDAAAEEQSEQTAGDSDAAATEDATEETPTDTASTDESASQTAATAATVTATTAASGAAAATATQLDDSTGAEMVAAEASARVKGVADGICSACHLSGVGGAPKIGDKAAWEQRAEKGLAAQVQVVAAGKGAMPARGGSDLSDEEIASAIVYMMSK